MTDYGKKLEKEYRNRMVVGAIYNFIGQGTYGWKYKYRLIGFEGCGEDLLLIFKSVKNDSEFRIMADDMGGFSLISKHIEEEKDKTEELNIHCRKIDIKIKETQPIWKDDVLETLGLSDHPFILIGDRDWKGFVINPAMFIKKDEQELQFVMLKESSKLATILPINPEDVLGEHPKYAFLRFAPHKSDYIHPDHLINHGLKFDVSPIAQPELVLGKAYVVKTDGKTYIGILHAIMDDYLKFIVNDFDGMEIGKMVIRAEDMKDAEIYKVDDLSNEE